MTRLPFRVLLLSILHLPMSGVADEYQAEASSCPRRAIGPDDSYVIVTNDREHIRATRYDAEGRAIGNPITVDDTGEPAPGNHERPEVKNHSVAMDADGNFVVAWESAGDSHDIHFRLFDSEGNHIAHRSYSNRLRPAVSMAASGEFLVTSKDFASRGQIVGEFFDRRGRSAAAPFAVSSGSRKAWRSASSIGKDGIIFVAYEERSRDSTRIRAVAIDQSGDNKSETLYGVGVTEGRDQAARNPAVASGPNGEVAVVWEEITVQDTGDRRKNVIMAVLDREGRFVRRPATITPNPLRFRDTNPEVRFDDNGQVVVSYSAHAQEIAP
jgi:hypothetical protein